MSEIAQGNLAILGPHSLQNRRGEKAHNPVGCQPSIMPVVMRRSRKSEVLTEVWRVFDLEQADGACHQQRAEDAGARQRDIDIFHSD